MNHYVSKFIGHTIVMRPTSVKKEDGVMIRREGQRIKFKNGHFRTKDPKIIEYLTVYMRKFPDELQIITESDAEIIGAVKDAVANLTTEKVTVAKIAKSVTKSKKKNKKK